MLIAGVGLAAVVAGALYSLQIDGTTKQPQADSSSSVTTDAVHVYVPGLPVRLTIPKASVDAPIDGLGLTAEGDLDAPKDITHAGWYNAGPRAGSQGSAVIDGHFGGTQSKPAVFDSLHTLQKGDLVNVVDSDRNTHVFVVRRMQTYQPEEDASEVFRSDDNKSHLNLITCQGEWVSQKDSYSTRLVIFTDLVTK